MQILAILKPWTLYINFETTIFCEQQIVKNRQVGGFKIAKICIFQKTQFFKLWLFLPSQKKTGNFIGPSPFVVYFKK